MKDISEILDEDKNIRNEIVFNKLVKETPKAYLLNFSVSWGMGGSKEKDLWIPKSLCDIDGDHVFIDSLFVQKLMQDNEYKGYRMQFDYMFEYTRN